MKTTYSIGTPVIVNFEIDFDDDDCILLTKKNCEKVRLLMAHIDHCNHALLYPDQYPREYDYVYAFSQALKIMNELRGIE